MAGSRRPGPDDGPDSAAPAAGSGRRLALLATCVVSVRAEGACLERRAGPRPLSYPELELLLTLEAGPAADVADVKRRLADRTGVPVADLNTFDIELRVAGHHTEGEPARHRDCPDHPDATRPVPPYDLDDPRPLCFPVPQVLRLRGGAFELIDHRGRRAASLTAAEVVALGRLARPATAAEVLASLPRVGRAPVLSGEELAALLGRLEAVGALRHPEPAPGRGPDRGSLEESAALAREVFDRHAAAQTRAEQERQRRTGRRRTAVVPVAFDLGAPAGLGMVVAHARAFQGGALEEHYHFRTDWTWSDDRLDELTAEPAVYLCSNYLWSHQQCLAVSERVKARSPGSITIHGGPDTPKYPADAERYLAAHPHVDVIVRGEGEVTAAEALAALAPVVGGDRPDLSVLREVPGLTFRLGAEVVRTPDRERVADLDSLPSPILTGLFDVYASLPAVFTLESNRGCPYGCTFCDWGSATNSRIRRFDLDRVLAEISWCAEHGAAGISLADANFGIFARDVEIARHVADCRRATGHPSTFGVSYAKNTVKHLEDIISILSDAGIVSMGVLSLQTMDEATLDAIHRSNIKVEKYDALANEMRNAHLPLLVELMMGLPGQTLDAFADDLQQCVDRGLPARINTTTLLVNSPMNEPTYLAEHAIETNTPLTPGRPSILLATSSYTQEDRAAMDRLRAAFILHENFGVLRLVARYVRHETGLREIDLYRRIHRLVTDHPHRWPALTALDRWGLGLLAPPYSWALMAGDLQGLLVDELQVPDDGALAAILAAQVALLPAHGRSFPDTADLDHDVVAWHRLVDAAKDRGHLADWPGHVPRLATFEPATLVVDDPSDLCGWMLGVHPELSSVGANWELDSPLARAAVVAREEITAAAVAFSPRAGRTGSRPAPAAGPAN